MKPSQAISPTDRRRGRPYLGGAEKTCVLQIKVTPEERAAIKELGKNSELTITDMVRGLINREPTPENAIPILIKNQPTYLTREQAKDLFNQLSKLLIQV